MSRSVLITGAAGFIGSHLAERCIALGWQVVGIDALTDYYPASLKRLNLQPLLGHSRYDFVEGDLLELELQPLVAAADIVFHLAAQPGVRASWEDFARYARANVEGTQRLLEAARGLSLGRFVIASSSSIYGDAEALPTGEGVSPRPVSPYGVTKLSSEHLAQVYWRVFGVPTVCLRYFTVYGPRQRPDMAFHRLIASALVGEAFRVFGDGQQSRDFTFVGDAVAGTLAAGTLGQAGSAYNIGGGSRRSMNDVFDTLAALLGSPVDRIYEARQVGDARDTAADISRARIELGYEPSVSFAAGLKEQLEWQQSTANPERSRAIAHAQ